MMAAIEVAESFIKNLETQSPESYRRLVSLIREPRSWFVGYRDFVAHLSHHSPNLILQFNALLPAAYKIPTSSADGDRPRPRPRHSPPTKKKTAAAALTPSFDSVIDFVNMVKIRFRRNDDLYRSFLDTVKRHADDDDGYAAAWPELARLFRHHPDVLHQLREILFGAAAKSSGGGKDSKKRRREPEPMPPPPVGSEKKTNWSEADYSLRDKHWRWEQERFEMDMLGSYLNSTAEAVKTALSNYKIEVAGTEMELEKHFTIHQIRTVEKLYAGDHCLEVMEALRRDPRTSLAVVLGRLEQRLEKWKRASQSMRKIGC